MPTLAVTAGTGLVGVRVPSHGVAQSLLRHAAVPIAAPSANRFGHVSPTTADHVLHDLGQHPIGVLADVVEPHERRVGIESTVARIDADSDTLTVLRRGGVSEAALRSALADAGLDVELRVLSRQVAHTPDAPALEAPGQLLTHYAPDVAGGAFLVRPSAPTPAVGTAVLDVGGALAAWATVPGVVYSELAPGGDIEHACRVLFASLRQAEGDAAVHRVWMADPRAALEAGLVLRGAEHVEALRDRMFRAASGKQLGAEGADVA